MFAETITGFINEQRSQNKSGSISWSPHMNSSNAGANIQSAATANSPEQMGGHSVNNRDDTSQILYIHFGNIINWLPKGVENVTCKEVSVVWYQYNIITSLVWRIITPYWRNIHNVNYREETLFWEGYQTDIENYADIHCFGRKILPISFTYKQFPLSLLLEKYPEQMNTPICSAENAYTLGSGETVILVFGEVLYGLATVPNKCRAYSISVFDNPTNIHQSLWIDTEEDFIPMVMKGSTCTFTTRCPMNE